MNGKIAVVYEKGVLRPLIPLNLPEHTKLEIRIVDPSHEEMSEAEKAYQVLYQTGLIQPNPTTEITPVAKSELQRVADAFGQVGPLSDVVIAERHG